MYNTRIVNCALFDVVLLKPVYNMRIAEYSMHKQNADTVES